MRGTVDRNSLLFDPEIEKTARKNRAQQRKQKQAKTMAETPEQIEARIRAEFEGRYDADYEARRIQRDRELEEQNARRSIREITTPDISFEFEGSIVPPTDVPENFQVPTHFMHLVSQHQFGGSILEDPYAHMATFTEQCTPLKKQGITLDTVRLMLFPFSLRDSAATWLRSQPPHSIVSWDDLAKKFTSKFFPATHTRKLKQEINSFLQMDQENLYEAWERFNELLRKCPSHNISLTDQVLIFYTALNDYTRDKLDTAAPGGAFDVLPTSEALEIINNLATRAMHSNNDRQNRKSVQEVETYDAVLASNKKLSQKMDAIVKRLDDCHVGNDDAKFDEEVKILTNPQNNPYSNTYNAGWRNHPNFYWGGQNKSTQSGDPRQYSNQRGHYQEQRQPPQQDEGAGKKNLEDIMGELAQTTKSFINESRNNFKNQEASIKNLENQVGQISKQLAERPPGMFPSNTVPNPKENISVVTLRSGKVMHEIEKKKDSEKNKNEVGNKSESEMISKEKEQSEDRLVNENKEKKTIPTGCGKIPFPNALVKKNLEKQFSKFLEVFKKLQINIPFSEALEQMPTYAKFMKDILSRRRKLSEESETIMLTEECSAILQKKLPPKLKDPGSFTISVDIEGLAVGTLQHFRL
ncbi:uncharacterized protein LOC130736066 [Lotus japonicus]|uniref:uncharacterized protein LOC130736066 n=1 Tax=Lotus japonicus TaxID=34305 RepID=UPI00258B52A0|nr:uncharacterized protein LOC130736066 [Lotus japonicus]